MADAPAPASKQPSKLSTENLPPQVVRLRPAHESRPQLVLAFTGPLGSGVSTLSRLLEQEHFTRLSLSDAIKREWHAVHQGKELLPFCQKDTPGWRQELQDIGDEKRKASNDYWLQEALKRAPADVDLVIDGIRNLGEIVALRKTFPNCFVVAVLASSQTRWGRVKDNYDGQSKVFERDDQRDSDEDKDNGQQVEKCVQIADYVIWNETNLAPQSVRDKELMDRIRPEIALMRGSLVRYPTEAETYITSAYAISYGSRCMKRFVGAVIVSDKGIPLSQGYNENPLGMEPCERQFHYCFKDAEMDSKLEAMEKVFCPDCGTEHATRPAEWICRSCGVNLKLRFFPSRNMELCTAIHAEERAIRSLGDRNAQGATMYVTTFPCFQCSRYIVDAGIKRVVYVEAYPVKESEKFLTINGVAVFPFEGFKARAFNRIFKQRA